MAVITIFLCADRFVPRARGSSLCCRGLLVGSRTGWSLLRQYWWAFSQIPFKLMVPCLPCVPSRPSSISYPAPDISVTSSLSGSGSISAKMKDDWTRPLLIGNPQGGQSSSRCGRSRYSNVGCGGCLVTLLQLLLDSSGAVPNSYYPVLRWDRS